MGKSKQPAGVKPYDEDSKAWTEFYVSEHEKPFYRNWYWWQTVKTAALWGVVVAALGFWLYVAVYG